MSLLNIDECKRVTFILKQQHTNNNSQKSTQKVKYSLFVPLSIFYVFLTISEIPIHICFAYYLMTASSITLIEVSL